MLLPALALLASGVSEDPLWSQLAALPILALQSNREQPGAVIAAIADGVTESMEKSLFLHITDEAVSAICANRTADLAARLSAALEKEPPEELISGSSGPLMMQQQQQQEASTAAASTAGALTPAAAAGLPTASASSHLELASTSPDLASAPSGASAATATADRMAHVWTLLPELLMQSIDTQALEALNSLHATVLQLAEATLAISDDLAHNRVPELASLRQHGAALMQQMLSLSGAWSPAAPVMVTSLVQEQIVAPLNQSGAEAAARLRALTGEDVGRSFDVLLERAPGNKVDALQTILRSVLQLYRNGAVQLLNDARAVVAPWRHNLTAASLAVVDGMRDSSLQVR
jgi:plasmid maintenance system antidote protein VapI